MVLHRMNQTFVSTTFYHGKSFVQGGKRKNNARTETSQTWSVEP